MRSLFTSFFYVIIFSLAPAPATVIADEYDTLRVYWMEPIEVTARYIDWGEKNFPIERDEYTGILSTGGYSLIRKGVFFAQDICVDGLKRGDINVTFDREHYHNACPNRMDSPLTRVNPMEMKTINMTKSGSSLQSGLGGVISFNREKPSRQLKIKGGIIQTLASSQSSDAAFALSGKNLRINGRYAFGKSYKDADGRSFIDLYGYKEDYPYSLGEISFHGLKDKWEYRASYSITEDVMFPYLMMDEREIEVVSGSIKFNNYKAYFNNTSHLMDNGLRQTTMPMRTDASNLTIGVNGDFFDAYYRNWNARNTIITPMMTIENPIMPDIEQYSVRMQKSIRHDYFTISGKGGFVYNLMGNTEKLSDYKILYPGAENKRAFFVAGAGASYMRPLNRKTAIGSLLEIDIEPPAMEYMYTYVDRPMENPTWLGNPEISSAKKLTFRETINHVKNNVEIFASKVWDYSAVSAVLADNQRYQTYKNIDAVMLGFNFHGEWSYFMVDAAYTWARNETDHLPLAEIPAFSITATLRSPNYRGISAFLKNVYTDSQTRIDKSVGETPSRSWNRVDAGFRYGHNSVNILFEVGNLLNEEYSRHLSYLRNPFASGAAVPEPGRSIKISFRIN